MLNESDLSAERAALERQRQDTVEVLARIDGALQLIRHLQAKCFRAAPLPPAPETACEDIPPTGRRQAVQAAPDPNGPPTGE